MYIKGPCCFIQMYQLLAGHSVSESSIQSIWLFEFAELWVHHLSLRFHLAMLKHLYHYQLLLCTHLLQGWHICRAVSITFPLHVQCKTWSHDNYVTVPSWLHWILGIRVPPDYLTLQSLLMHWISQINIHIFYMGRLLRPCPTTDLR